MQLNFNVMPEVLNRESRAFLDSPVKPENDKNVSLLIAILVYVISQRMTHKEGFKLSLCFKNFHKTFINFLANLKVRIITGGGHV